MIQLRHRLTSSQNERSPSADQEEAPLVAAARRSKSASKPKIASDALFTSLLTSTRHQWAFMKPRARFWLSVAFATIFFLVVLGTVDSFYNHYGLSIGENFLGSSSSFAVAINTYKRPDMLRQAVRHYADNCGRKHGVGEVYVLWAEQDTEPPSQDFFFSQSVRGGGSRTIKTPPRNRASINVIQLPKDSLNARFLPIDGLNSQAVFMVDDDVRVSCPSLFRGFMAWEAFPDSMVGYYPRLASPPRNSHGNEDSLVYYSWPTVYLRQQFNFVLTKASFLHCRYLELYSSNIHPREILDYVDKHKNCEDVAMSMLVANHTKDENSKGTPAFPIYVEGAVSDKGLFGGISTGGGHHSKRSACLVDLTLIYEKSGWGSPLSLHVPLEDHSWLHHAPGYWWQARPSNFFEWFAIENFFV